MPRPIWSGSISFGLVNIPVKLTTATSQKDVRFHQLHAADHTRIRQKRVCPADGQEVPFDEIVKGYEISPERYVVITPEELDALDPKATRTIDIEEFVDLDQIDPIFFDHSYYLVPDERSAKPYALLVEAMRRSRKVAIARFVLRTKQYLCAVRASGNALVVATMLYADEVVPVADLGNLPDASEMEVGERELAMAEQLIASLSVDAFEPQKFRDEYRERVIELIERKAEGEEIVAAPVADEATKVVDLMAALEASLAAAKASRERHPALADEAASEAGDGDADDTREAAAAG